MGIVRELVPSATKWTKWTMELSQARLKRYFAAARTVLRPASQAQALDPPQMTTEAPVAAV